MQEPNTPPTSNESHETNGLVLPRAITIEQFIARYHVCRTSFYELWRRGEIRPRKVGARVLIDVLEAERWWSSIPFAKLAPVGKRSKA